MNVFLLTLVAERDLFTPGSFIQSYSGVYCGYRDFLYAMQGSFMRNQMVFFYNKIVNEGLSALLDNISLSFSCLFWFFIPFTTTKVRPVKA